ncbi:MAG: flavodoxin family protein [Candidatus Methanomethylophilaceae archaeon]|nr:flavodoxin family protein [Candidatus Methanomethylophilaceae archaeon]
MRVLVISGASAEGNTSKQCRAFLSGLPSDWESESVSAGGLRIAHCEGCNACRNGKCRFDDDMCQIFESFDKADIIVFATPVRFNAPSSQIKTVMDRFQFLWNNPGAVAKKRRYMTFIGSAGRAIPDVRSLISAFRSFCLGFGGTWLEHHVFAGTDSSTAGMEEVARDYAVGLSETVIAMETSSADS